MTSSWVCTLLDLVPVVGTVKNTVEAVTALCHGDTHVAKEKGFQAVVGGVLDVATLGAGSIVERLVVKGIEEGGEKVFAKQVVSQLDKNAAKDAIGSIQKLSVSELKNLRRQLWKKEQREKSKKKPAKRGEHVINNNVLKFFRSVIEAFMSAAMPGESFETLVSTKRITPGMRVYQAYKIPLTPPYKAAVQEELVAQVPNNEPYIDANSVMYGFRIGQLRQLVVNYMLAIYRSNHAQLPTMERAIIDEVEEFIAGQYFVDHHALNIWLEHGGTMARYEDVKGHVIRMFRRVEYHGGNDEVIQWVRELRNALA